MDIISGRKFQPRRAVAREASVASDAGKSDRDHRLRSMRDRVVRCAPVALAMQVRPGALFVLREDEHVCRALERFLELAYVVHVLVVISRQIVFQNLGHYAVPSLPFIPGMLRADSFAIQHPFFGRSFSRVAPVDRMVASGSTVATFYG
jgi:hypothetical protein